MVPEAGLEPALCYQNWILNPARLPISPLRQDLRGAKYIYASLAVPVLSHKSPLFVIFVLFKCQSLSSNHIRSK